MTGSEMWRQVRGRLALVGTFWRTELASVSGWSDVTGVLHGGRACFLELKGYGDELRPEQRLFLRNAARAGAECWVLREYPRGVLALVEVVSDDFMSSPDTLHVKHRARRTRADAPVPTRAARV